MEIIIKSYIENHGSEVEKITYDLYEGQVFQIFSQRNSNNLEEALELGIGETALVAVLVFILEKVAELLLDDGYKLTKGHILSFLKKDSNKIKKLENAPQIDEEVINNLISTLADMIEKQKESKA